MNSQFHAPTIHSYRKSSAMDWWLAHLAGPLQPAFCYNRHRGIDNPQHRYAAMVTLAEVQIFFPAPTCSKNQIPTARHRRRCKTLESKLLP